MYLKMHLKVSFFKKYCIITVNTSYYTGCPGTQSEQAGKTQSCQGCPNQGVCASGLPKAPDPGGWG